MQGWLWNFRSPRPPFLSCQAHCLRAGRSSKGLEREGTRSAKGDRLCLPRLWGTGSGTGRPEPGQVRRGPRGRSDEFPFSQVLSSGLPGRVSFGKTVCL